jgi:hypothetical protein
MGIGAGKMLKAPLVEIIKSDNLIWSRPTPERHLADRLGAQASAPDSSARLVSELVAKLQTASRK